MRDKKVLREGLKRVQLMGQRAKFMSEDGTWVQCRRSNLSSILFLQMYQMHEAVYDITIENGQNWKEDLCHK